MMNRTTATSIILASFLTLAACGSDATPDASSTPQPPDSTQDEEATRLWVRSALVDCEGSAPQKCMQISRSEAGEYELFYDQIDGFTFVDGTAYVLDVKIDEVADPPADGSSQKYSLLAIVSEER